jgi:glycosyltransferase involved in cell wall biosynthesis
MSDSRMKLDSELSAKPVLSVVIAMRNEQDALGALFERLVPAMKETNEPFEIICVDDGSTDRTYAELTSIRRTLREIRIIRLSRNFGKEIAMTAGLDHARGDAVIFIDADLQDPPELIVKFVELWRHGYQHVYGIAVSRSKEPLFKRTTSSIFYRFFKMIGDVSITSNAGDFRLLAGEPLAGLRACREQRRFMKALYAWVGYPSVSISYVREARSGGSTKFNYWRLWNFALEGITSHSSTLLRIWTYVGLLGVTSVTLLALYLFFEYFISNRNPTGFYLATLTLIFVSAIQMISLGLIG